MTARARNLTTEHVHTVLKEGKTYHSPHFSLKIRPSEESISRFSFVVPKKTAPKATTRNTIKRKGRAALRPFLPHLRRTYHGMFMCKKGATTLSFSDISTEIKALLTKAQSI